MCALLCGNSARPSRNLTLRPRVSIRDGQGMEGFIRMTGVTVDDLRDHASDPGNLGAVLDYLLADERCLLEFTERAITRPIGRGRRLWYVSDIRAFSPLNADRNMHRFLRGTDYPLSARFVTRWRQGPFSANCGGGGWRPTVEAHLNSASKMPPQSGGGGSAWNARMRLS